MSDEQAAHTNKPKANTLDGVTWARYSISVWSDIQRTAEECALEHRALFPVALVRRLLDCFTGPGDSLVIDPFCGVGSTLLAARAAGKNAVGIELVPALVETARARLAVQEAPDTRAAVHLDDAINLLQHAASGSADLCITSPPAWGINTRQRGSGGGLGQVENYAAFLDALAVRMEKVFKALRPGAYCCVVVVDAHPQAGRFPFHIDLTTRMLGLGFAYDDLIVWDRRSDYNNLRPLGYPHKFRINKVHEFILIFQKPGTSEV